MSRSSGPALPHVVSMAASVPYANSFALIGGYDGANDIDTVYVYDVSGHVHSWKRLPSSISQKKRNMAAVPVDKDMFPSC